VEGELIPMAQEMGLGVTPWGPLKGSPFREIYPGEQAGDEARSRRSCNGFFNRSGLRSS